MTNTNVTTGAVEFTISGYSTPDIYSGTCGYEAENTIISESLAQEDFQNITSGANVDKKQQQLVHSGRNGKAICSILDRTLLIRASEIIEGFDPDEIIDSTVNIESLRGIVLQLWETAKDATQFHQEILALLESAILSVENLNQEQLSVIREATKDLQNEVLAQVHVDIMRRRFLNVGFSPLTILSEIDGKDD